MNRHSVRWLCAATLILGLTACTSLTDANGGVSTPTPEPSSTELTGWEREQLGMLEQFGIPEPTPEPFTKENLPDPTSFIAAEGSSAVTKVETAVNGAPVSLRLSKLSKSGPVVVQFVCVDGTMSFETEDTFYPEIHCDGQYNGVHFEVPQKAKSFNIKLTASAGTSYSLAAYRDASVEMAID